MTDLDFLSCVQGKKFEDLTAKYYPALEFFFKNDILLWNVRAKVFPGNSDIHAYSNIPGEVQICSMGCALQIWMVLVDEDVDGHCYCYDHVRSI